MGTTLYYFSATGNSLTVAKKIREKIGDANLISIPKTINEKEVKGEVIGIICPIYMFNPPHIVIDFIKKIKSADYIFMAFSGAGGLGSGIRSTKQLFKKQGLHLNALFNISMPSNFTPYGCPDGDEIKRLLDAVDNKIDSIEEIIMARGEHYDSNNTGFFQTNIHPALLYKVGFPQVKVMDKGFTVNSNCNGCGICEQVCPVNNIKIENNAPTWNQQCEQCYGCLQWCPRQAIEYGERTKGVDRYRHPDIKVKEIIASASDR